MRFYHAALALLAALLIWALFTYNYNTEVYVAADWPISTPMEDTAHYLTSEGEVIHHADH